jgi:hypothetical protein
VLLLMNVLGCNLLKYVLRLRSSSTIVSRTTEESALMEFSVELEDLLQERSKNELQTFHGIRTLNHSRSKLFKNINAPVEKTRYLTNL